LNNTNKSLSFTKNSIVDLIIRLRTILVLLILIAVFGIISDTFFTLNNAILVMKHVALYSFIGIGMTFVIITGGIDLSVGSIAGLSGMIAGFLINRGIHVPALGGTVYFAAPIVILITLIVGALFGMFNALLVGVLKMPPFIATLGTMYMARGFANLISGGLTFPNLAGTEEHGNKGFEILGTGKWLNIPVQIWIMILMICIGAFILNKTVLGSHIYAVGGNLEAARLSGIKTSKVLFFVYGFSGALAAVTGMVAASQLVASHPATGETWETYAIAATVLGGTSMSGGTGKVGGTVIGLFVITVLNDGMVMVGISEFWQKVITGIVVIVAVIFDIYQQKIKDRISLNMEMKKEH